MSKGPRRGRGGGEVARRTSSSRRRCPAAASTASTRRTARAPPSTYLQKDYALLNSSYDLQGHVDLVLLHFPPCLVGKDGMALCNANKKISCTECDAIKQQWSAAVKAYEKGLF